jgi:hypothetical protein
VNGDPLVDVDVTRLALVDDDGSSAAIAGVTTAGCESDERRANGFRSFDGVLGGG